ATTPNFQSGFAEPRKFYWWLAPHFYDLGKRKFLGSPNLPDDMVARLPPHGSVSGDDTDAELQRFRWARYGKSVSVGDDGTIVGLFAYRAYRYDGTDPWTSTDWTPLLGVWIDVSVVSKSNMWGVDRKGDIYSTIV